MLKLRLADTVAISAPIMVEAEVLYRQSSA